MARPTKTQAEGIAILLVLVGLLTYSVITDGVVDTILLVIALVLIILALNGIIWLARKLGR